MSKTIEGTAVELLNQQRGIVLLCLDDDDVPFTIPLELEDLDYIDESVIGKCLIYAGGEVIPLD